MKRKTQRRIMIFMMSIMVLSMIMMQFTTRSRRAAASLSHPKPAAPPTENADPVEEP